MNLKAVLAAWVLGLPLLFFYSLEARAQTRKVPCRFSGDGIVNTSTGEQIQDWQIADFQLLSRYRSDETRICTLLTNTSDYKWVSCIADNNGNYADAEYYERFSQFQPINGQVQEAIKSNYPFCQRCSPQDVDRWHGGCKISVSSGKTQTEPINHEKFLIPMIKAANPDLENIQLELESCQQLSASSSFHCAKGSVIAKYVGSNSRQACNLSNINYTSNAKEKPLKMTISDCEFYHDYPFKLSDEIRASLEVANLNIWTNWISSYNWLKFRSDKPYDGNHVKLIPNTTCTIEQVINDEGTKTRALTCSGSYQTNKFICKQAAWKMVLNYRSHDSMITINGLDHEPNCLQTAQP